eukprot:CAMPEP_0172592932 /NCGR_PEP_ID=MMETSP1068-20121228/12077_1 /TAXON_ID=35684 /ORGANISM="Pseudopedinella elastica, Strain CCMP716" /LENGTH=533 /DNA_ID=CAMNT_0013390229 /DNA_START=54 /DNA_END=1652 /DNA_ORIENTATION=+
MSDDGLGDDEGVGGETKLYTVVVSNVLLALLVFGLSASVDVESFKSRLERRNGILIGLGCQFFLLPFIGFLVVKAFGLNPVYGTTLLIVVSSPGGSYSNLWCSLFNADIALSVAMTAASTMVSALMLPVNLLLYINLAYDGDDGGGGATQYLDWGALFTSIAVVMASVTGGLVVAAKATELVQRRCNRFGNLAGVALVVFSAVESSVSAPLWDREWRFYLAVPLPCILGLVAALALTSSPGCGLARPERVSVAIETCYQNVGVATAVALSMFQGKDQALAVGVPLYYGGIEALLLGGFCLYAWKAGWTYAPAQANEVLRGVGMSRPGYGAQDGAQDGYRAAHSHATSLGPPTEGGGGGEGGGEGGEQGGQAAAAADEEEKGAGGVECVLSTQGGGARPPPAAPPAPSSSSSFSSSSWASPLMAVQREVSALCVVVASDYQPRPGRDARRSPSIRPGSPGPGAAPGAAPGVGVGGERGRDVEGVRLPEALAAARRARPGGRLGGRSSSPRPGGAPREATPRAALKRANRASSSP